MRFSAVAALCVAPLVLAGTLEQSLRARGALALEVARSEGPGNGDKGGAKQAVDDKGDKGSQKNNNNNGNVVIVQQQSTEVILIWVNQGNGAATQTVTNTVTVTQNGGAQGTGAAAAVATHSVTVGGTAGLVYSPEQVIATPGDLVVFTFMSKNHTVTQSAFDVPCKKIADGFDSGFMANPNNTITPPPQMAFQVTTDKPIWFYCRQAGHCGQGMTFSINPTANKTQADFKELAIAQNGTGVASPITGGAPASAPAPAPPASTDAAAAAPPAASTAAAPPAETAAAPPAASSGSTAVGTGTIVDNGACNCACLCSTGSFPNAAIQGIGAFGGLAGSMPMAALA